MPLKLKNQNVLPARDFETVTILGIEMPLRDHLPFGRQVEVYDLQSKHDAGEIGKLEFLMRLFCVFTRSLPASEHVRYERLGEHDLEEDEIKELSDGVMALLGALGKRDGATTQESGEGNAPEPEKGKAKT